MYKACSVCGRVHDDAKRCYIGRVYAGGNERALRNKKAWHRKSFEIRERAQFLCEVCRDLGEITYKNLEVHHIEKVRDREDLLLDNYNLICLCQRHHKEADDGKLDIDYLRRLAERREDN